MATLYANPPEKCDLCDSPIGREFRDTRLLGSGQWANVCPDCYHFSAGLGTGKGQEYHRREDGRFEKTAG